MAGTIYYIYCDESSTGAHPYLAIGGLLISGSIRDELRKAVVDWKTSRGLATHEMKWSKAGNGNVDRYVEAASRLMRRIAKNEIAFRAVVFKASDIDYGAFHEGDGELGYNRFLYELLFHCLCPLVPRDAVIIIHPDKRNTKRPSRR